MIDPFIERAQRYSKGTVERMGAMKAALEGLDRDGIDGDIVECGVWKGGHIVLARLVSPDRLCWLYDTFSGMTAPTGKDGERARRKFDKHKTYGPGWMRVPQDDVVQNLKDEGVFDDSHLRFVAGDVAVTLRDQKRLPDEIALLRLDTDWYESTKIELEVLYPRLRSGGVLIVDDYGHWQGARKAVDEYFGKLIPGVAFDRLFRKIDYTGVLHTKA